MRAVPKVKSNRPLRHLPTGIAIYFVAYVSVDVSFCTRVAAVMAGISQMYLVRKHGLLLAGLQVPAGPYLAPIWVREPPSKNRFKKPLCSDSERWIGAGAGHNGLGRAACAPPIGCWCYFDVRIEQQLNICIGIIGHIYGNDVARISRIYQAQR
jgi:hypothetical protein